HRMPEYSVVQPSTRSASASGMSNGMRSISAIIDTLNTMKPRICGEKTYHAGIERAPKETSGRSCCRTIVSGLREPVKNTRAMTDRIIGISYAMSIAAARSPPTWVYLLFAVQQVLRMLGGAD